MKVAVYTLTRDRLDYTKHCFEALRQKAGVDYCHFVIDNGSRDGTAEWLQQEYKPYGMALLPENVGISAGSNIALDAIQQADDFDLVIKMDNDCEVESENIIGQMVEIFSDIQKYSPVFALSPRVEGIVNQPMRGRHTQLGGRRIGLTAIIGGLFLVVPQDILRDYRYPIDLPLAWGQDDHFCKWFKANGGEVGYVEGLVVNHYETTNGQAQRYPEYFERKWREEKIKGEQVR